MKMTDQEFDRAFRNLRDKALIRVAGVENGELIIENTPSKMSDDAKAYAAYLDGLDHVSRPTKPFVFEPGGVKSLDRFVNRAPQLLFLRNQIIFEFGTFHHS